jgi:hypothetical protein
MPGKPVEPIPHGNPHVERDVRQVIMMALPITPLPLSAAHRHGWGLLLKSQRNAAALAVSSKYPYRNLLEIQ